MPEGLGLFIAFLLGFIVIGAMWGVIGAVLILLMLPYHKAIIRNLATPKRALMPGAIVSALISGLLVPEKTSGAFLWTLVGVLLMLGALVVTLAVNVPIDNQIRTWTMGSLPSNWRAIRDHW